MKEVVVRDVQQSVVRQTAGAFATLLFSAAASFWYISLHLSQRPPTRKTVGWVESLRKVFEPLVIHY